MNQAQVARIATRLKNFVDSGPLGVTVRRYGSVYNLRNWYAKVGKVEPDVWRAAGPSNLHGVWREERWRIERGSGVAGHGDVWRLVHITNPVLALEPCRTVRELESVMRKWRNWRLP